MSRASPERPARLATPGALALLGVALAMRIHNALRYPADWGFDAPFNWRYVYRLTRSWELPNPASGWATGDPPLYFYTSAALMRAAEALGARDWASWWIPLLGTAAGLGVVALAVRLVRVEDPHDLRRARLAGGLLLFLPAHVQMSAMVNEEMLAALLISLALYAAARRRVDGLERAAAAGLAGGLALLTKLSGVLVVAAAAASHALDGWHRRRLRPAAARIAVLLLAAALAGGWYYARNRLLYGFFQPFGLPAHEVMFSMPPGERGPLDYLRVPLATFGDPQLLNPDLLRSVWGSTYATVWFDGHRFFLPRDDVRVSALGTLTLLLALLPTAAFALGLAGGLRRARAAPEGPDAPLLLLTAVTLAGYALFTWRNPWFAVVKGTSLLGLSLPFAYYASGVLARWTRTRAGFALGCALAALAVCVVASSTFDLVFEKTEVSGLPWQESPSP